MVQMTSAFTLDSETFKKILPVEYHKRFASEGIRPDGRSPLDSRALNINPAPIHNAAGSALVKLGNTTVVCGIRAEITAPDALRPRQGMFVPNLDLPALCSPIFRPGPPGELCQSLIQRIHKVFEEAEVLDLSTLCITPGKAVWVLYADIVCLNYEGNVLDAAVMALTSALKQTTLPNVQLAENEEDVRVIDETRIPLQMNRSLYCTSFCVVEDQLLIDPTSDEDAISSSHVSVILDQDGTCCGLFTLKPLPETLLDQAVDVALSQSPNLP